MEEFDIANFDIIDKAITLVAQRNSGKSHLLTDLLYMTILKKVLSIDILTVIIYCQSLIDSNTYYMLYIYYQLIDKGYDVYEDNLSIITSFKLKTYIKKEHIIDLTKNSSDEIIKQLLDHYIDHLIEKQHFIKRTYVLEYNKCVFYFNGSINKTILSKLCNFEIQSTQNRKYIVIVDDVNKEKYRDIKSDVITLYEQGRHKDISIVVIDQYIKSNKVPPEIRGTSSHLIIRSFDEKIKKEIAEICAFDKNYFDIETIKDLINNYYSIIIDYDNKTKLFYYKSPKFIFRKLD